MSVDVQALMADLRSALPDARIQYRVNPGPSEQSSLLVAGEALVDVCRQLKEVHGFDLLSNVTGVDWPDASVAELVSVEDGAEPQGADDSAENEGFLEIVYHLYATEKRVGPVILRARTQDREANASVPSVVSVYRSAEFQEREIYDLFGVIFTDHPDLRRILMWDEFEDHPMRKDYVAPDDYDYEPTPHGAVLEKAKRHYPSQS